MDQMPRRAGARRFRSGWSEIVREILPELNRRGVVPDVLTDQTSAHDELNGYIPTGLSLAEAAALRAGDPQRVRAAGRWRPCECTAKPWSR